MPPAIGSTTPDAPRARAALSIVQAATLIALLLGLQPVLTDVYLPSLPLIVRALDAPMGAVQQTMSVLILAFGLMQLVWGPVADRFGRRPVLLVNLALLVASSVGAALADDIGALIAWRSAQGAALAAAVVCARAMVRDLYEPHQGAHVMAWALSGLGVIAVAAPLAGGLLAAAFGWRAGLTAVACFSAAALLAVAWWLPETLAARNPRALQLPVLARNARAVVVHPTFRAWALLVASTYGGLFMLLSASSYVYIGRLGMTSTQYGLTMAGGSFVYLVGTFVCRRWLRQAGLRGAVRRGAGFTLAGGLGMAACALLDTPPVALVLACHAAYTFGHGMHQPCGQAGAVGPFPQMAGVASALTGCLLALVAFGVGLWLSHAMDGSLRPLGLGLAVAALCTASIAWTLVQRHGEPPRAAAA
ncbi:MAG: Bcr/CflA family efflux MFS transporter [Aquincola sp.]|nr:Bcr/CflA family efflux MFS transporter [Aquincola sp.]